jgi:hypothetical protein
VRNISKINASPVRNISTVWNMVTVVMVMVVVLRLDGVIVVIVGDGSVRPPVLHLLPSFISSFTFLPSFFLPSFLHLPPFLSSPSFHYSPSFLFPPCLPSFLGGGSGGGCGGGGDGGDGSGQRNLVG